MSSKLCWMSGLQRHLRNAPLATSTTDLMCCSSPCHPPARHRHSGGVRLRHRGLRPAGQPHSWLMDIHQRLWPSAEAGGSNRLVWKVARACLGFQPGD